MTRKILITGGAGFIGSSLALEAETRGHEVLLLDNLSEQIHGADSASSPLYRRVADRFEIVEADVRNSDALRDALQKVDTVVHLAAETGTGQSMYDIANYVSVNIDATGLLLDLIANDPQISISKLVVASSRAVYGEGKYECRSHGTVYPLAREEAKMAEGAFEPTCPDCGESTRLLPTDENSKKHPTSLYGITKSTQEDLVLNVGGALGIPTTAFRYQNVYGPGQSLSNPYTGILSIFSTRIRNENPIDIYEDGLESRDFIYIDDVVKATMLGIEIDDQQPEVYNVGSGVATTVVEVVEALAGALSLDFESRTTGAFRIGDIRHNVADLEKISTRLGFAPEVSFEQGVANFCKWVLSTEAPEDNYDKSIAELSQKGILK